MLIVRRENKRERKRQGAEAKTLNDTVVHPGQIESPTLGYLTSHQCICASSVPVWIFRMLCVLRVLKVQIRVLKVQIQNAKHPVLIIYSSARFRQRIPIDAANGFFCPGSTVEIDVEVDEGSA